MRLLDVAQGRLLDLAAHRRRGLMGVAHPREVLAELGLDSAGVLDGLVKVRSGVGGSREFGLEPRVLRPQLREAAVDMRERPLGIRALEHLRKRGPVWALVEEPLVGGPHRVGLLCVRHRLPPRLTASFIPFSSSIAAPRNSATAGLSAALGSIVRLRISSSTSWAAYSSPTFSSSVLRRRKRFKRRSIAVIVCLLEVSRVVVPPNSPPNDGSVQLPR